MKVIALLLASWISMTIAVAEPLPVVPEEPAYPGEPDQQRALRSILIHFALRGADAANNVGVSTARQERAEVLSSPVLAVDWVGIVYAVEPTAARNAFLSVHLAHLFVPYSLITSQADSRHGGTLIQRGTPLFETVSSLRPGQRVQFSGQLVCVMEIEFGGGSQPDCPRRSQRDDWAALAWPAFLFRFDRIRALD